MKKLLILATILLPVNAYANPQTCMAAAMYFEARNQGIFGMLAVGVGIRNRGDHPDYPSTVCGVVRQGRLSDGRLRKWQCQFTFYCDGKPEDPEDQKAWTMAQYLAGLVIESQLMLVGMENATHYHATTVRPQWAQRFVVCKRIGSHIFYEQR